MNCFGRSRSRSSKEADIQCDIEDNFNVSATSRGRPASSTDHQKSVSNRQERNYYRHVFLIRHGNYNCKPTTSAQDVSSFSDQKERLYPPPLPPPPPSQNVSASMPVIPAPSSSVAGAAAAAPPAPVTAPVVTAAAFDPNVPGNLTELGKRQAENTGRRLRSLQINYTNIVSSDLSRTKETAALIAHAVGFAKDIIVDQILNEGALPQFLGKPFTASEIEELWSNFPAKERFDQAFRRYLRPSSLTEDSYDVIVCHCNIIKYFIHRAFGINLAKISSFWFPSHSSITIVSINSLNQFFLRTLGDCGHMDVNSITVNNLYTDVFWNSWKSKDNLGQENENVSLHRNLEEDFVPTLGKFESLMWKKKSFADDFNINQKVEARPRMSWTKIQFSEYRECAYAVVEYIRSRKSEVTGYSDLLNWVCRQKELLKRHAPHEREALASFALERLVETDFVLVVDYEGDRPTVVVHPNFNPD